MKQTERAFTLIELLVVIAIIALLAAILFPVFARAKLSAKRASSIANAKQLLLGTAMYSNDVDDMAPISEYNDYGHTLTSPSGVTLTAPVISWLRVEQPYLRNWQIVRDPGGMLDPLSIWAPGSTKNWEFNWQHFPEYGMNREYLNPTDPSCWPVGVDLAPGLEWGLPISNTSVANPSETVFLTTTKVVSNGISASKSHVTLAPAAVNDRTICAISNGGWGDGSYGDKAGWYPGNPTYTGPYSTHYFDQGVVGMMDGSAKAMPPGKLAAGTNWHVGIVNWDVVITDRSKYIWDTQ